MPPGSKAKYTSQQRRQAKHIEESYETRGVSEGEAEGRAWAAVNKMTGGGREGGSGRRTTNKEPAPGGRRPKIPAAASAQQNAR